MAFPISNFDLEGRGFSRLARFVHKNWPGEDPINLSFAQELLSRSLGYKDFHDLQQSAGLYRYKTGPVDASKIAPTATAELQRIKGVDQGAIKAFVESWPLNLLTHHSGFVRSWAIEGFPEPVIEALREAYEFCWRCPAGASLQLHSRTSFYDTINLFLGYEAGSSFSLVTSKSILEALEDAHPNDPAQFIEVFKGLNEKVLGVAAGMVMQGRFLPRSAFKHPDLADGLLSLEEFLSGASLKMLAEQFLEYATKEKLTQNIFDLYLLRRNDQGFFRKPVSAPKSKESRCRHVFKLPQGELTVVVLEAYKDHSAISFCTWTATLMSPKGECIGSASGGLYESRIENTGSGTLQFVSQDQDYLEFGLISAYLRRIRQRGVPIDKMVDSILLENAILTVQTWEKSRTTPSGTGLAFLDKALGYIADQIEQPLYVVGNIRPMQYVDMHTGAQPKAISDLRAEDELRISTYLEQRIDNLPSVKNGQVRQITKLSPDPISSLSDTLSALI